MTVVIQRVHATENAELHPKKKVELMMLIDHMGKTH
jgi:hypothetical protein